MKVPQVLRHKKYIDRTEWPIFNYFPLGSFLWVVYVCCFTRLWQHVGLATQGTLADYGLWPGEMPWFTNAGRNRAIPVVNDMFSKEVVETLGQANALLAQILTGTSPTG